MGNDSRGDPLIETLEGMTGFEDEELREHRYKKHGVLLLDDVDDEGNEDDGNEDDVVDDSNEDDDDEYEYEYEDGDGDDEYDEYEYGDDDGFGTFEDIHEFKFVAKRDIYSGEEFRYDYQY